MPKKLKLKNEYSEINDYDKNLTISIKLQVLPKL